MRVRPLPPIAAEQCGVFSLHQAHWHPWSDVAVRHAVRSGRIIRLRTGVYQAVDLDEVVPGLSPYEKARWRHAAAAIAGVLATPGAQASHSTAAVLRGMPLLFLPSRSCATVPPGLTGELPRVHLHRCTRAPDGQRVGGVDVTSDERMLIDLAREHGMPMGVVAVDHALHVGSTTLRRLNAELERCRGWPGLRAARDAIAFADGRTESVLESRSRLTFRRWGLPAPIPQVRIGNEWGGFIGRVDFYWPEFGVAGEADGDMKYDGEDVTPLIKQVRRQSKLEDLDLPVVRWSSRDLADFGPIAARLSRTFARASRIPVAERRWTILPPL